MNTNDIDRHWAALPILEHLETEGANLTSEQMRALLGARSTKGIGAAMSQTKATLLDAGIRLDEALCRRTVRKRTEWRAGPRIAQARHELERTRRMWQWLASKPGEDSGLVDAPASHTGPVLVLRTLRSMLKLYEVEGSLSDLDAWLDDDGIAPQEGHETVGEIFIDRIETAPETPRRQVPEGYGENGIWIRGRHDHAHPHVATGAGSGRYPSITACIAEANWLERKLVLDHPIEQIETAIAHRDYLGLREREKWTEVEHEQRFRYVHWIGARGLAGKRTAAPLRMRLRCWYEIVIETATGKRIVLHEEGLRGDDSRTASRAIERWRHRRTPGQNTLVVVHEVRIAKRQPRPSTDDPGPISARGASTR